MAAVMDYSKFELLRYNISDWSQLPQCLSNNSPHLHISVSSILDGDILNARRIAVRHDRYGTLFSCLIDAYGKLISDDDDNNRIEFSAEDILHHLKKYGFLVTFNPREHLPYSTLEYLLTLKELHYDKLRTLSVYDSTADGLQGRMFVVAFNPEHLPLWLNNEYAVSMPVFKEALVEGYAVNVSMSPEGKKVSWGWLDYIANIEDILEENSR